MKHRLGLACLSSICLLADSAPSAGEPPSAPLSEAMANAKAFYETGTALQGKKIIGGGAG